MDVIIQMATVEPQFESNSYNILAMNPLGGGFNLSAAGGSTAASPAEQPLPRELTFTSDSLMSVIAYSILLVVAAVGNLTVLAALLRHSRRRSRINLFILHLSIADLIVTFGEYAPFLLLLK